MSQTPQFTHLHLHTEYSLLDGANKIKPLAKKIKKMGMTSVAMTDHGNMFGAIDFYNQYHFSHINISEIFVYLFYHQYLHYCEYMLPFQ